MQIDVPAFADCDFTDTYLMPMKFRIYTIKMMDSQKPKKDQMSIVNYAKLGILNEKKESRRQNGC